ncbi:MAG: L-aspartate oxidase [Candidatus Dormiibacterota bacterium]
MVVVGSGIAGLAAALAAAPRSRVLVVSKGPLDSGCTPLAQGGIAAAVGPGDSPELHFQDTIAAGRGLCDERAVRVLVEEAPAGIAELASWGVRFDATASGELDLHQEAAHSRPRVLHAGGDATGAAIETALIGRLLESGAEVLEEVAAIRLVLDGNRCAGVEVCHLLSGEVLRIGAGSVILASGGAAGLWRHSTNPPGASGDGIAMAFEAGAEVADLEFVQFHPTVLALPGAPPFLISEAVRGEGGEVVGRTGRRFLFDSDPRGELAPRDIVARAIAEEMLRSGVANVLLDCRRLGEGFAQRFPTIAATCRRHGLDPAMTPIPIAPAAHYTIGGVATDLQGATTLDGLYACGEVARTGVHGANRLASNSLIEGLVFGRRTGEAAAQSGSTRHPGSAPGLPAGLAEPAAGAGSGEGRRRAEAIHTNLADIAALHELRELMWSACGISRTGSALVGALTAVDQMRSEPGESRASGLARTTARLVLAAALDREESRGAHHRDDFPLSSDRWGASRTTPTLERSTP